MITTPLQAGQTIPAINQAKAMLDMLAPDGMGSTFQTFDDNAERGNRSLIQQHHGTLNANAQTLLQLNKQGAGVFVTVNQTDGKGRKQDNIRAIRALFVDFDTASPDRVQTLLTSDLPPNLIIESSPNKHHAYWIADGIALSDFTQWQKRLIYYFKMQGDAPDEAVHDLPRVMRLAGFYHQKVSSKKALTGAPFLTRIAHQGRRYDFDEVKQFIDSLPAQPQPEQTSKHKAKQSSAPILPQSVSNDHLPRLSADTARSLARGRWQEVLGRLGYQVSFNAKEHYPCPICGGTDRFRFDDEHGTGSFICSQGGKETIAGDGLSLLADHANMGINDALAAVTGALDSMGLISPHDGKTAPAAPTDWKTPKHINQTLPPVLSITKDMMPESLWRYTQNNAERLSTSLEYVAIPLVVALASVIGTKCSILPKFYDDWEIVPNLWGAIIGNPSTKKSPAVDSGMKPLNNLDYQAKANYDQAKKDFATQREVNKHKGKAQEDELKALAKKQAKQADDDENRITDDELTALAESIAAANQADDNEPMQKRYIANDGTYQKLGEILAQTNNGLLIARDELTGLLASLDGEANNEARNFYLEAFNGTGSHVMDRIGRGSIFIETHCLSVIGGIQPNKLERYLEKTIKGLDNDGLMQRFQLAVYPDQLKGVKERDIAPNKEIRKAVYDLFETIDNMSIGDFLKFGANPPDNFHKRPYFRFTKDAYHKFLSWYDTNKAKADDCEHSVLAEHLNKYPKTVASLALIFHLVDSIEHGTSLGAVGMNALNAALAWQSMLESHAVRIYSLVTDSANIKAGYLSDKLLKMAKSPTDKTDETLWINGGFTARQVIRKGWKGLTDANDVQNALEVLIEHHWLNWQEVASTGQGGRPTERYFINPKISELMP